MNCICVSIHLMLLFIKLLKLSIFSNICFNTSHVTLYPVPIRYLQMVLQRFNTSHVTLYLVKCTSNAVMWTFQYISCYSLSIYVKKIYVVPLDVSIHLMLLFIGDNDYACIRESLVSIHLMLLFIPDRKGHRFCEKAFQYISCYSLSEATSW